MKTILHVLVLLILGGLLAEILVNFVIYLLPGVS